MQMTAPFWETKSLQQMTDEEWESLCDGCGRCGLHKIQVDNDHDSKDEHMVRYTRVACRLLDVETCRCSNYWRRKELVPNCVTLDTNNLKEFNWLPKSCAYRRLYENRGLADWHPLVSGNKDSVHEAGISVSGIAVSEEHVHPDEFPSLLIEIVAD